MNRMNELLMKLSDFGVVPVIAIDREEDSPKLARALLAGGLPCAEITFRTAAAEGAIKQIARDFPEIVLGAGTVLTLDQAERAVTAGARFIVSPGFNGKIVEWCIQNGIPVTPGIATPTEINMALDKGLSLLKFFPAEALGGVKTLKAVSAPFGNVKFIPTGGINANNLADYLSLPSVAACGGSWMVKRQLISEGQFDEIAARVKEALRIVRHVREGVQ
jgi:2-dehydro-3-deoxyphosphogluconate aldolase/(4S)-4-hydroxy-2-oxoglutarate aldolase